MSPPVIYADIDMHNLLAEHRAWLHLTIAIVSEVVATTALKHADGYSRFLPTAIVFAGYVNAFWWLSLALRTIPLGIAYAIWSGAGIVLVALLGLLLYGQRLDLKAMLSIGLILVGVILFSMDRAADERRLAP